jgi:hypothetical protein
MDNDPNQPIEMKEQSTQNTNQPQTITKGASVKDMSVEDQLNYYKSQYLKVRKVFLAVEEENKVLKSKLTEYEAGIFIFKIRGWENLRILVQI